MYELKLARAIARTILVLQVSCLITILVHSCDVSIHVCYAIIPFTQLYQTIME